MAAVSAQPLPLTSEPPRSVSPSRRRLSKVLNAGRRRSSDAQSESGTSGIRASLETLGLSRSTTTKSQRSPSRAGSIRSSTSGSVKNLLPGHAKRERRRVREDEMQKLHDDEITRGRQPAGDAAHDSSPIRPSDLNRSHSSLISVDSDTDARPPLVDRDSHSGLLTMTSPLITTTTVDDGHLSNNVNYSTEAFPVILEPPVPAISAPTSPRSPALQHVPSLPVLPLLVDKADTLRPMADPSRARGKSPARRFKDVFHRSGKSPRVSPERKQSTLSANASPSTSPHTDPVKPTLISQSFSEQRMSNNPDARGPSPLRSQSLLPTTIELPKPNLPEIHKEEEEVPRTPPQSILRQPTTTVTPPTPTDPESRQSLSSPTKPDYDGNGWGPEQSSPQNGHRRTRSQPGTLHQKSKLSTSAIPPLTPTIEEVQTPDASVATPGSRNVSGGGGGGGFFSSWVSAAQNAATSISGLTNQNRARAGTSSGDANKAKVSEGLPKLDATTNPEITIAELSKKEQAVATLGSGDLNLSHLGIEASADRRAASPSRSEYAPSVKDDVAARMEDILAKKAVSQAYEKPTRSGEATPVAEIPDPVASVRPASTFGTTSGTLTPPNGSIYEGETSGAKRSESVRSKIHRRSRGSSITTSQSTIGAMIGASTATLANPATGPKLSGFAVAPKQRNRAFHQQFRSVPEDDFLIEDYSCALQKEILLAGRIYISEGHICFSSNILGWVTTLIISFDEVVSIEKENTAIVIPNAIAVQTLHARHTFRSLLSREATYDLMIGIWRVSHPDSFQKSMNGQRLAAGSSSTENVDKSGETQEDPDSENDTSDSDASDDDEADDDSIGTSGSVIEEDVAESKTLTRKPSGGVTNGPGPTIAAAAPAPASGDATSAVLPAVAAADGAQDFPGPATHAPTDCTDSATHYDKIIKDEIIPAPLGKVYSLLYGAKSGSFCRKFLLEGSSKAQDLQMEDDKKGLDNDIKTRKYQYIKPLGGSIGPKQTTCITTETLETFDLEKAVSVSCSTATPDVPSGSAFTTKTRYCLSWAPGNATRFQMNMTVEWTAKSWLKGPIEKGALDGQHQYGEDLVKTLKAALGRARAPTTGSKVVKNGKKKRKSSKRDKPEALQSETKKEDNWGAFEILKPVLGPVVTPLRPFVSTNVVVTILAFMILWMWVRGPASSAALARTAKLERLAHYDQLWQREENGLWDWLQDRAGVDGTVIRDSLKGQTAQAGTEKQKLKQRQKMLKSKDMQNRLAEEKKSMKEMEEAVRVTQERLDALQRSLEKRKQSSG